MPVRTGAQNGRLNGCGDIMARQQRIMGNPVARTKTLGKKKYEMYVAPDYQYVFTKDVADGLVKSFHNAGGHAFRYLVYNDGIQFFVVYYRRG